MSNADAEELVDVMELLAQAALRHPIPLPIVPVPDENGVSPQPRTAEGKFAPKTSDYWEDVRKLRALEWVLTPPVKREPKTKTALAAVLGIDRRTLHDWLNEPVFRARWEKESKDIIGDPSKVAEVIENMRLMALDGNMRTPSARVGAAKLYLDAVEGIKPPAVKEAARQLAEMSDDELRAMIAEMAQVEAQARGIEVLS